MYTIELTGRRESGRCACCGSVTQTVWGFVSESDECVGAYYVNWTKGEVRRHGAFFDLILGEWGEEADADGRLSIAMECRFFEGCPSIMVIDAADRQPARSALVGQALARSDVIGTPWARIAFDILDTIWLTDPRLSEFREGG